MAVVILKESVMAIGVCVPADWDDERIAREVNAVHHCGTSAGWHVRKEGDSLVSAEAPERAVCEQDPAKVHVVMDC